MTPRNPCRAHRATRRTLRNSIRNYGQMTIAAARTAACRPRECRQEGKAGLFKPGFRRHEGLAASQLSWISPGSISAANRQRRAVNRITAGAGHVAVSPEWQGAARNVPLPPSGKSKPHREALAGAADPETASSDKHHASTPGGRAASGSRKPGRNRWGFPLAPFCSVGFFVPALVSAVPGARSPAFRSQTERVIFELGVNCKVQEPSSLIRQGEGAAGSNS